MQAVHTLADFAELLRELGEQGLEFTVIGGCAVGAYASLRDETLVSADLDIYVSDETLRELIEWARHHDVEVVKRPRPRNVPVALLRWRALEVNALTASAGLPDPATAARTAREFILSDADNLAVPIADPFDLLANKRALRRKKDLPHIAVLRRFIDEEVVTSFEQGEGRHRFAAARRLLAVLERQTLPEALADRLIERASQPVDFRFLLSRVPTAEQRHLLLERASSLGDGLRRELEAIPARSDARRKDST